MGAQKLGLVFFPAFDWAISPNHPEREERLLYTRDQIIEEGLLDMPNIREYKPKMATYEDFIYVIDLLKQKEIEKIGMVVTKNE